MISTSQIRELFLEFFKKNDHSIVKSSPLIPKNDPTLMFTTAGMVQFKNLFTGVEKEAYTKAASSQKCVRAGGKHNDLENVGYTARHHTFFEMLGNFSFGDYFKDQAINLAWEFLTKELGINRNKLYITIYHNDNEAFNIWKKLTGFTDDKIIRISSSDNFWSAGERGPCGPCSEIFYDHGDHVWGGLPGTNEQDGDRFVEIWNLVFMQFDETDNGRISLPKPSIDTGMGLERISAVMQNVKTNYDIDLFENIINYTQDILKVKINENNISSYRVIADHLRSASFLIADGVSPSNEGRGYVLRRIIRRAIRHINSFNYDKPLLHQLTKSLNDNMGDAYPELKRANDYINQTLLLEEERFRSTLSKGLKLLNTELENISNKHLPAEIAFKLYDTYGFPLDLTKDILRKENITLAEDEFEILMQKQKDQARSSWIGSGEKSTDLIWYDLSKKYGMTEFVGYELDYIEAICIGIVYDNNETEKFSMIDEEFYLVVNQTPFYAESGGQLGDKGAIFSGKAKISVIDTHKYLNLTIHHCKLNSGYISIGDNVKLSIDIISRNKLRANHSATHLLHSALRKKFGNHITQKGSLVTASKLRFDINHTSALTQAEKAEIELIVNKLIIDNTAVTTVLTSSETAIKSGALALFGEKYDQEVRVVSMGLGDDEIFSTELCGGTHVKQTGDIGYFKIINESSIASGIRRIEALTGLDAIEYSQKEEFILDSLIKLFKTNKSELYSKIENLIEDKKNLERKIVTLKKSKTIDKDDLKISTINNINFTYQKIDNISSKEIRELAINNLKELNVINVLLSIIDSKIFLVVTVSENLIDKFDATNIVNIMSSILGGRGGGGKKIIAQAGGIFIDKIDEAIETVKKMIKNT